MGGGLWLGGHSAIGMLQVLHIWVFQYIELRVVGGKGCHPKKVLDRDPKTLDSTNENQYSEFSSVIIIST